MRLGPVHSRHIARAAALLAAVCLTTLPIPGTDTTGHAAESDSGRSPALCGPNDTREPGIQGDVPAGATADYNCGLTLVGEIPKTGVMQAAGHCAYVASGASISVIDVSDPANPTEIGTVPTYGASETMRAVVNSQRSVLVFGRGVYDISNCEKPVFKGEIQWPTLHIAGIPQGYASHDLRVDDAGTTVYSSFGLWKADITNLDDPSTWTVTNLTCDIAEQYVPVQMQAKAAGVNLCDDLAKNGNGILAATGLQGSLLWPQLSHSPDTNESGTRLYIGDQSGGSSALWQPEPELRVIDLTQSPPKIIAEAPGAGHSVDWFRTADGREFVLHANEAGTGDTCLTKRPESLGWAYDADMTEVTHDKAKRAAKVELAINKPEFCQARKASGQNPTVSYHSIDNPSNAKFAMVSFGSAGLRVFDIRNPTKPTEVAYFNQGPLVHAGVSYYDSARGLIYIPAADGFKVLKIEPQVSKHLHLTK